MRATATAGDPPSLERAVDELLLLLELQRTGVDCFRGQNERARYGRLFGGQVIAQGLIAAAETVADRLPHSLHAYFLRLGDVAVPVDYSVDRVRDGRSFATRRVLAVQAGDAILNLAASFQVEEPGFEHQGLEMPEAPPPESLPTLRERAQSANASGHLRSWVEAPPPVDSRPVHPPSFLAGPGALDGNRNLVWFRIPRELPDDPLLHRALLAYASDLTLLDVIAREQRAGRDTAMMASLDHALWFHRDARVDEWLLFAQDNPVARGARGLARGSIFSAAGELVASVAQEGLARPLADSGDGS